MHLLTHTCKYGKKIEWTIQEQKILCLEIYVVPDNSVVKEGNAVTIETELKTYASHLFFGIQINPLESMEESHTTHFIICANHG